MAALSPEFVARRLPLWVALSDLCLDTEPQPETFRWIAREARDGGFSVAETRDILEREVLPVFGFNLMSVAGEWAMFPEDEVRAKIVARLERVPVARGLQWLMLTHVRLSVMKEDWSRVEAAMLAIDDGSGQQGLENRVEDGSPGRGG